MRETMGRASTPHSWMRRRRSRPRNLDLPGEHPEEGRRYLSQEAEGLRAGAPPTDGDLPQLGKALHAGGGGKALLLPFAGCREGNETAEAGRQAVEAQLQPTARAEGRHVPQEGQKAAVPAFEARCVDLYDTDGGVAPYLAAEAVRAGQRLRKPPLA